MSAGSTAVVSLITSPPLRNPAKAPLRFSSWAPLQSKVEKEVNLSCRNQSTMGWMTTMKSTRWVLGRSLLHSLVRSHHSLIRLLRTARFARALCCAHSFARSLTHSLTPELMGIGKVVYELMRRFHSVSTHCAILKNLLEPFLSPRVEMTTMSAAMHSKKYVANLIKKAKISEAAGSACLLIDNILQRCIATGSSDTPWVKNHLIFGKFFKIENHFEI